MLYSIWVFIFSFAFTAVPAFATSIDARGPNVIAETVARSISYAAIARELQSSLIDFTKDKDRITSIQSHKHNTQQVEAVTEAVSHHLEEHVPRWLDIRTAIDSRHGDLLPADGRTVMPRELQDVIDLVSLILRLVLLVVRSVLGLGGHFDSAIEELIKKAVGALAALLPPDLQTPGPYIGG
ncbi:hypothetical protein OC846_006594 [Tilletia horrida]|uniref:RESC9 N-terminal region domain-containing protein n=1 Tax=Tilletia horrida TaxID=155126 RepID=A0AAN6GJ82_9BASI|nr:hypothetical protein OC845_006589 [Tilletia horrida]KAK0542913.1 hypothetical protein OC846_006594 [Tilletia horrida]KAK0559305.1 hypothetical protein OC861_006688 [Tilletia horrida]